jgi:hypothetical protein
MINSGSLGVAFAPGGGVSPGSFSGGGLGEATRLSSVLDALAPLSVWARQ